MSWGIPVKEQGTITVRSEDKPRLQRLDKHVTGAIAPLNTVRVPAGKKWLFCYGTINHITGGTGTRLTITSTNSEVFGLFLIEPALADGAYPMDFKGSQVIAYQGDAIALSGNGAPSCYFRVIEMDDV